MSRTSTITCAAVLDFMRRHHKDRLTLAEIGTPFGLTSDGANHYIKKLVAAGDVLLAKHGGGGKPSLYALTHAPVRYVGEVVAPRRVNLLLAPPLQGHEARLRAAAELAMTVRRA